MHRSQYTQPAFPFHAGPRHPFGGQLRWLPLAVLVGSMAVVARPVAPLKEADWLARLAESGNTGAQLELGLAYRDGGSGLAADPQSALYWLKRAAQSGDAYAADQLGNAYAQGDGTAADPTLARHWWQAAAQAGNADAKRHLGQDQPGALQTVLSVLTGKTLNDQAHPALLARAEAGDATAQFQVAIRYRDGAGGFPQDAARSADWLARAAASGNVLARELSAAEHTVAQNL
jgi:uncharacterized protein